MEKKQQQSDVIQEAKKLGCAAFHSGIDCIPVWDKSLTELIAGESHEIRIKAYKAWIDSWDLESWIEGNFIMGPIYIPKIDTSMDWFNSTVEHVSKITESEPVWVLIESDSNPCGDLIGYFKKNGVVYRASWAAHKSTEKEDCIIFEMK